MSISKQGIWKENSFSETLLSQYDTKFYTEPDGSVWIRIFHHGNPASVKFASTDTYTTSVYKDENRWFNCSLCYLISGTWELMYKEAFTSSSEEMKFRWTQKTNPMEGTYEDVSPTSANIVRNTSSGYSTTTAAGGIYKLNSSCYLCITNSSKGNWFGAIGAWNVWNNGIPGYPGLSTAVTTGYIDLYLRVDGYLNNKVREFKTGVTSTDFYEI